MIGWRVFYDQGRVYDSREHDWASMPEDGMQVVVVYLEQGERIISGQDYYFKAGDVIGGNDDPPDMTRERYPGVSVKRGRWTSDEELARLKQEARKAR